MATTVRDAETGRREVTKRAEEQKRSKGAEWTALASAHLPHAVDNLAPDIELEPPRLHTRLHRLELGRRAQKRQRLVGHLRLVLRGVILPILIFCVDGNAAGDAVEDGDRAPAVLGAEERGAEQER